MLHWRFGNPTARIVAVLSMAALLAADERGEPSILRGIFGIALLIFGPLFGGIALGFVQAAVYKALVKSGAMRPDSVPMFPILMLRGMIALIALIAGVMFYLKASGRALPFSG
jgi:hypothetical protein